MEVPEDWAVAAAFPERVQAALVAEAVPVRNMAVAVAVATAVAVVDNTQRLPVQNQAAVAVHITRDRIRQIHRGYSQETDW